MNLVCALCLDDEQHPLSPIRPVVTIANGQAVCAEHFATVRGGVSSSAGALSLWAIRRNRR